MPAIDPSDIPPAAPIPPRGGAWVLNADGQLLPDPTEAIPAEPMTAGPEE